MELSDLQKTTTELIGPRLERLQRLAMTLGVIGLALTAAGAAFDRGYVAHSYLYAYLFWLGVTTGSLGFLMVHHMTGGGWGYVLRRFLEAATRLLLLMLLLAIPIFVSIPALYEWARWSPDVVAANEALQLKSRYLNAPFFITRTVIYFAIWWTLAFLLNRWGATLDERPDRETFNRLNVVSGAGVIIYALSVTFAAVDWVMSLDPTWVSSILGMLTVVMQGLSTLALMVALLYYLAADLPLLEEVPSGTFRDIGNLMLAFVMLWAYMSFSQYVIQYSGNTAEEVSWYLQRRSGGWGWISLGLIPLHFFLPFIVLLVGSGIKRNLRRLAKVAVWMIVMRFVDLYWWVTPTFRAHIWPDSLGALADLGTPLLIGGIWLWVWVTQVKDRTVVPLGDPRLLEALAEEREAVQHG